ncbi:sugar phosphate isomerase/epimerase family protein [Kocuria massiliensis]|uniref:sugar phosphate isomerase/epimerase family protein n=1 Tax=Kocuria massiliensis TaxID=1926282 RepID=UPI001301E082|nr:sugar phosphate isomerase/epimerase [Kocuria massiliensis]
MKTSFHTGLFSGEPVLTAIKRIQDAGFEKAELNAETLPWAEPHITPETTLEEINKIAATDAVSSIAAHREGLANPDPARRSEAIDWTIDLAQKSVDLGAPLIHVIAGDAREDSGLGTGGVAGETNAFIESLKQVVDQCSSLGVAVGLEPIVGQLISSTDETLKILNAVPNLGVSFDPSHLEVTTHDVTSAARNLGDRTLIAALKDGEGNPDRFTFPPLGAGNIDFPAMVKALRQCGFDGYLVVEHEAHVFGDERSIDEILAQSYSFIQNVLQSVK